MSYSADAYKMGRDAFNNGDNYEPTASESWKAGYMHAQRAANTAMMVDVITADRDPDAPPIRTNRINYNSVRAREWLASHSRWALASGYTLHLAMVS